MDFAVEVICLTDPNGKPVPPGARPFLVERAEYSTLDEAIQGIVHKGDWEVMGPPLTVSGHSAVLTVRRGKTFCSIHILQERNEDTDRAGT